jgi:hypothetical protein
LALCALLFAGSSAFADEPIMLNTKSHQVTSPTTIDFSTATVLGLPLTGGGAVSSVFGRTGAVLALTNDYTFAQIGGKPTTLAGFGITDAQPLDADLTAIAALTTDPFGRGLLPLTTAAAVRTYIGAGTSSFDGTFTSLTGKPTTLAGYGITDAQPLDSDLTSIAALATTSYGRGFLPLANSAAALTYIGAQAAGSYEVPLTFSQSLSRAVNTVTLSGDSASPGASKYYGTDSGSTKGWFALPAGGAGTVTTTGSPANGNMTKFSGATSITNAVAKTDYWDTTDFVASGASGAHGLVPSPGLSAGTTKFLREDATWVVPAGGGGGTPGGSNTQVQFNDSSAFGGDADLTWDKTNNVLTTTGRYVASEASLSNPSYSVSSGSGLYGLYGYVSVISAQGNDMMAFFPGSPNHIRMPSVIEIGWSSAGIGNVIDTGFARNAAGVVEVNNGTPGTYRDILTRGLVSSPVAFASRIGSPVEGTQQAFTDSTTNVSGATITGGGSNHILGYYNGTNWIVDSGTGAGGGGVTSVATTSPITGGTITTTGTLGLDVSVDHAFTGAQSIKPSDAATNTVVDALTLAHNSSGVIAANFGTGLLMSAQDSTTANVNAGEIQSIWTTPTHNSNISNIVFKLVNGSTTLATAATLKPPGVLDVTTGFRVGGAAGAGKVLRGNGTNFITSTETYAVPGTNSYGLTSDGTNWISKAESLSNGSSAQQTFGASAVYLAGSTITVTAGDWTVGSIYKCAFDITKTAAGVATPIVEVRVGTAGSISDTVRCTLTFPAQTAIVDVGTIDVWVNWRVVGASAILQVVGRLTHNAQITGLSTQSSPTTYNTSAAFASTTATKIGVSFNGGTSFSGTNEIVQAEYKQP